MRYFWNSYQTNVDYNCVFLDTSDVSLGKLFVFLDSDYLGGLIVDIPDCSGRYAVKLDQWPPRVNSLIWSSPGKYDSEWFANYISNLNPEFKRALSDCINEHKKSVVNKLTDSSKHYHKYLSDNRKLKESAYEKNIFLEAPDE